MIGCRRTAKRGVSLGIATHSVEKVLQSALGRIIIGCKHRYYLPNRGALQKKIREIYEEMGLPENAIRTIASLRPQRTSCMTMRSWGGGRSRCPWDPLSWIVWPATAPMIMP